MSEAKKGSGGGTRLAWPLFVVLPLIVAVAVFLSGCGGESSQSSREGQPSQSAQEEQPSGPGDEAAGGGAGLGNPSLGDAGAPVVMLEYADFQ